MVLSKALAVPCKEESEELFKFVNGLKSNELVDAGLKAKARYELKDAELAVTYQKMENQVSLEKSLESKIKDNLNRMHHEGQAIQENATRFVGGETGYQ